VEFALGDLLNHPDFGLTLATGDPEEARSRRVRGAHAIEVAFPTRWVPPDWVMLTTGLRLRGRRDEQRKLVAELDEHGVAALGWAVGMVVQDIPAGILQEAKKRDFPVFRVPIEIPFRDIIRFINQAHLSDDLYVMRRVMAMQKYLMDALHLDDPEPALVDRLATMLEADVILFGTDGSPVRQRGRTDPSDFVDVLGADRDSLVEAEIRGRRILGLPVLTERGCAGWLAMALPRSPFAEQLAKPVIRTAARLLGLVAHVRHLGNGTERRKRTEVLLAALERRDGRQLLAAEQRARALGIDFTAPARGVIWTRADGEPVTAQELEETIVALEAGFAGTDASFLLAPREDRIVGVVQGEERVIATALRKQASDLGLRVGLGRVIHSLADAAQSLADAELALRNSMDADIGVVSFDELDAASWLLASCDRRVASQKIVELLAPLREQESLLQTLQVYFDAEMNVAEAARRLNVHRNTLRYRLARIESLLGLRLESPQAIANLHLALMTERLDRTAANGSNGANGSSATVESNGAAARPPAVSFAPPDGASLGQPDADTLAA
jgi:purine catabolism regulator